MPPHLVASINLEASEALAVETRFASSLRVATRDALALRYAAQCGDQLAAQEAASLAAVRSLAGSAPW